MEFEDVVVKENPGLCRCCLSEGCYKDLGTEYIWMNETEVYAEMLLECFDISISQHMEGPNGPNRLICEVCITRLRDACNFKKQVLECEKKFVDMVGRGEFKPKVVVYQPVMKSEVVTEAPAEEDDVEYLDEVMEFDDADDEPLKRPDDAIPGVSGSQEITVSTLKVKGKRGRPKKTSEKPERKAKVAKLDDKPRSSKTVAKGGNTEYVLSSTTIQNRTIRQNELTVLQNSSVVPFMWQREIFLCFICRQPVADINELIEHTAEHDKSSLSSALRNNVKTNDCKIKVEVTMLACTICDKKFEHLTELTYHLNTIHNKFFDNDYECRFVPYKLLNDTAQCGVCNKTFAYYRNLNQHMNEHYGKHVCELCGKIFLSLARLRQHIALHRVASTLHCNDCSKTFETHAQWMNHEETVHKRRKLFKCFYCDETFKSTNSRKRHHIFTHDIKFKMHSCPECKKEFQIKYRLDVHYKSVHEKERTFPCLLCGRKFFNRSQVKRHTKLHDSGGRVQQRDLCK